jgi:hypothetical protein
MVGMANCDAAQQIGINFVLQIALTQIWAWTNARYPHFSHMALHSLAIYSHTPLI